MTRIAFLLAVLIYASVLLPAQETPSPEGEKGRAVLAEMIDTVSKHQSVSVFSSGKFIIEAGSRAEQKTEYVVKWMRPNYLSMTPAHDEYEISIVSDGKHLYFHFPSKRIALELPAEESVEENIGSIATMINSPHLLTASLSYNEGLEILISPESNVELAGDQGENQRVTIDGDQQNILVSSETKLPVQWEHDLRETVVASGDVSVTPTLAVLRMSFMDWKFDSLTEKDFAFRKPEGTGIYNTIPSFYQAYNDRYPARRLVGTNAPATTLDMLNGDKINLADHHGKDVVIVDFWASWCGPCRILMPRIEEIAAEYADDDVVFYSLNIGEPRETAESYAERAKLKLPVAVDPAGRIAAKYLVGPIPQTIVIGKDGVVHHVHFGVTPTISEDLRSQIDALLGPPPPSRSGS